MSTDPYYTRKQVPEEFIEGVGFTGLTASQEADGRERKFSVGGVDVRRFDKSSQSGFHPQSDPFYSRKPVPDELIQGVGETGLTAEEEFENRERKYSVTGVDVRRFDKKADGGFHPANDPYYQRKSIPKTSIAGVGTLGISAAEAYETRENKAGMFEEGRDPFAIITGSGQGQGARIDQAIGPDASAQARRRSSAVAPDAAAAAAAHHHHQQQEKLTTVESRDEITPSSSIAPNSTGLNSHPAGTYHDQVTASSIER